jgi:hypothetical protein
VNFLDVPVDGNRNPDAPTKASLLNGYNLQEILQLKICKYDKYHAGTIREWILGNDLPQLRNYVKSPQITQMSREGNLETQAHLVVIVGSRHILLWDMDKEGNAAGQPRHITVPKRWTK